MWSDQTSTFTGTGCTPTQAGQGTFTVEAYGQQQGLDPKTRLTAWLVSADPSDPPNLDPKTTGDLPDHSTGKTTSSSIPAGSNTWMVEARFTKVPAGKYQLVVLTDGKTPQHALVDTSAADGLFTVT